MSNPSCPPSSDEILKSLQIRFKKLNELYEESLKVNNDLKNKESKNRDFIKSLKRQRTYLVQKMQRIVEELTNKLSLVESECNIQAQKIQRMRSKLNDYSKKLEEAQKRDTDSDGWTIPIWGYVIGGGVGLGAGAGLVYHFGWKAVAVGTVYGAAGGLLAWGLYSAYNYFFGGAKPGVTKVNIVVKSDRKNKTE